MRGTTTLRQVVDFEPYLGDTALGETFGPPVSVRCRFERTAKVLRSSRGDEVVADAYLVCRPGEPVATQGRVTFAGTRYRIADIHPGQGPHSQVNHLEVMLRAD